VELGALSYVEDGDSIEELDEDLLGDELLELDTPPFGGASRPNSAGGDKARGVGGMLCGTALGRAGKASKSAAGRVKNGHAKAEGKMEQYNPTLSLAIRQREELGEPKDFIDAKSFFWGAPSNGNSNGSASYWLDLRAKPDAVERLSEARDGTVTAISGRGEY